MDWYLYKFRHLVENAFCKIKDYRAIATRFDKLKRNFENIVNSAQIKTQFLYVIPYNSKA